MAETLHRSSEELASLIPTLDKQANKYSRGCCLVVAGSHEYPGAACMAALACARSGAGYTRLATPKGAAIAAHAHLLSIPIHECSGSADYFSAAAVDEVIDLVCKSDALVLGPGMGTSAGAASFLKGLVFRAGADSTHKEAADTPTVFDADALNILSMDPDILEGRKSCVNVLTPHEGEAARLLGRDVEDRKQDALLLAQKFNAIVVLKGHHSLIACPDGTIAEDTSAGPELAKAGTGDVLSGIIAAFMAQGVEPFDAACLGVHVHALAAKQAISDISALSVLPEDILSELGACLQKLEKLN